MQILHFLPVYVPAWQFGGPILSVSRLCEGLVSQGAQVRVITTNAGLSEFPDDQLGIPQNINGVEVIYYPVDKHLGPIRSSALVAALPLHMQWAQLLHLSSIWHPLGLLVQQAAHLSGVPVIQTLRGALGPYSFQRSWWKKAPYFWLKERPLLQRAAALHCTTKQEACEIAWLRLKPHVEILPNPLDLSQHRYDPKLGQCWRLSMGLSPEHPLLLVAGRIHHKKGLDLLPPVLKSLSHMSWQLLFVGQDDDRTGQKLRRSFHRFGLSHRVHWIDPIPATELIGPYNASDCLLLPSRHENFGNVVVEALACGSGVLISDKVGVADSIGACPGVTVAPRNRHSWTDELRAILSTRRPSQISADWVSNYYSKELIAQRAIRMYSEICLHE